MKDVQEIVYGIVDQHMSELVKHVNDSYALKIVMAQAVADGYKAAITDIEEGQNDVQLGMGAVVHDHTDGQLHTSGLRNGDLTVGVGNFIFGIFIMGMLVGLFAAVVFSGLFTWLRG